MIGQNSFIDLKNKLERGRDFLPLDTRDRDPLEME